MTVAVLVSTCNSARFIGETLGSISAQERLPDEVFVTDDYSRDNTCDIVAAWAARQPFPVHMRKNRFPHTGTSSPGPAGPRTTALHESTADLIAVLDDDDLMLPHHLRRTEEAFLLHPRLELCFGDAVEFSADLDLAGRTVFAGKRVWQLPHHETETGLRLVAGQLLSSLVPGSYVPTCANLFRRKTALELGGFDRRVGGSDDLLFWSALSRRGPVAYYPFAIGKRRLHANNMSHPKFFLRQAWDQLNAIHIIQAEDHFWRLSPQEAELVMATRMQLEAEVLYHASKRGMASYRLHLDLLNRMRPASRLKAKDFVRAALAAARSTIAGLPPEPAPWQRPPVPSVTRVVP